MKSSLDSVEIVFRLWTNNDVQFLLCLQCPILDNLDTHQHIKDTLSVCSTSDTQNISSKYKKIKVCGTGKESSRCFGKKSNRYGNFYTCSSGTICWPFCKMFWILDTFTRSFQRFLNLINWVVTMIELDDSAIIHQKPEQELSPIVEIIFIHQKGLKNN